MAVDELHGVAGLAAGVLLRERHDVLARVRRKYNVVPKLRKELVRQREEAVQHKATRDTHGFLSRVALAGVILEKELLGARVEGPVQRDLLLVDLMRLGRRPRQVKALEDGALEAGLGGFLGRHQSRAHGSRDREVRAHGDRVAPVRAEGLDDGGVVRHAALEHDVGAHGLCAHNAVQVVAHDGEGKAGQHVGFARARGKRRVDGRLDEDGATLAEVDGGRGAKRQRAVVGKRDAQASGLLLDERARARGADLVHLEVRDLAAFKRDVLRVLSADLEHRVYLRVCMRGTRSLARDLVNRGVGTHELGHQAAARAGGGHGVDGNRVAQALGQRGQALAHGVAGVSCRAQVLRVEHAARPVEQHEVRRGGAHVDAERRVDAAVRRDLPLVARQVGEALARHVAAVGQGRHAGQRADGGGAPRLVQRGEKIARPQAPLAAVRMQRRADCLREQGFFSADKLVGRQAKHLAHRAHDAGVERDAARERDRCLHGKAAHDERLVALDHGVAQPQQDVLDGRALLLAVDDVRLREDGAPARDPRHRSRARDQPGVILDREAQARHLVLEEGARARGAALVHGELRNLARRDPVDVAGVLPTHRDDGAHARADGGHARGDGGDVLEDRQRAGGRGLGDGARGRACGANAHAGARVQLGYQGGEKPARRARLVAVVRGATAPQQVGCLVLLANRSAGGYGDELDRARARVYANGVVHVVLSRVLRAGPSRPEQPSCTYSALASSRRAAHASYSARNASPSSFFNLTTSLKVTSLVMGLLTENGNPLARRNSPKAGSSVAIWFMDLVGSIMGTPLVECFISPFRFPP